MKRLASLLLLPALVAVVPMPAHAGSSTDAALGLGAFAVFNQIIRGETIFHGIGRPPIVHERVVYVPAPPPPVVYPRGYWVARHGHWVWVGDHHGRHGPPRRW